MVKAIKNSTHCDFIFIRSKVDKINVMVWPSVNAVIELKQQIFFLSNKYK